jgi:hypothetical protein
MVKENWHMGYDYKQANKELSRTQHKMLREDLKIILGFFGFKVKEN